MQTSQAQGTTASIHTLKQRVGHFVESQAQLEELISQREALQKDRDSALAERDTLNALQLELGSQRDALQTERDALAAQLQESTRQCEALLKERDSALAELNQLSASRAALIDQTTKLQAALDRVFPVDLDREKRLEIAQLNDPCAELMLQVWLRLGLLERRLVIVQQGRDESHERQEQLVNELQQAALALAELKQLLDPEADRAAG